MPAPSTKARSPSRAGFFVLFPLLLLLPEALLAGSLRGRLLDGDTGRPVSGAAMTLRAPSGAIRSTHTDTAGGFNLEDLHPETWNLRVERLGYRPLQIRIPISSSPTAVELHLESLPLLMDEMVVRARHDRGGDYTGAFVEVISLGGKPAPGADLAEVLDRAVGVNTRRYGGLGAFSTVSIRGSTAEQVAVFLDGVELNSAAGGGVDLASLPLGGVESVEIYRGSVPARFGGNSIGGIVHIRTLPLAGKTRTRLHTGTGSHGTLQLGASVGVRHEAWKYLVLADYRASRNDFRFLDDNGTEYNARDDAWARRLNSDFRSLRGLAKIGRSLGSSRLQVNNTLDLIYKGIPGIGNNQSLHTRFDTWRHIAEAALFGPLGFGRAGYRLKAQHSLQQDEYRDRRGEVGLGRQHDRNLTQGYGLRGEVNILLPAKSLLTGFVAARRESFAPKDLLRSDSRFLRSRRHSLTLGTEVELSLGQRLTFNAGTQAEGLDDRFFDRKNFAPSTVLPSRNKGEVLTGYRLGATLDLGAGLVLKAHDGSYQRAPSFFELFGDRGAVIGNTNLVSEIGRNQDLGLVFRRPGGGGGIILAEAVFYRNRVKDLIRFIQNSQRVSRPHNLGRALLGGVETRAEARLLQPLSIRGNYAYQRAENRTPFSFERGNDLPNAPRHRLNTRATLNLTNMEVYCEFSRESRHFLDRANLRGIPVRTLYNLGGNLPLAEGISISWELSNLTGNQVADLWGYPLPGRSYRLSIGYAASR